MALLLEVATAIGCPIRCSYCPQAKLDTAWRGARLMTNETFRACMANTPKDVQVCFASFCEPYLNPLCSDFIRWIAEHKRPWQIFTTGLGMTESDAMTVYESRPDRVTIHIPAADDNMRLAVTPGYIDVIRTLAEGTVAAGAALEVMLFGPMRPDLAFLAKWHRPIVLQSRCGGAWPHERVNGPARCSQCPDLDHPTLMPDGTLTLCCNDYELRHTLGDLATTPLTEIMRGDAIGAVRAALQSDGECACRYCDYCHAVNSSDRREK